MGCLIDFETPPDVIAAAEAAEAEPGSLGRSAGPADAVRQALGRALILQLQCQQQSRVQQSSLLDSEEARALRTAITRLGRLSPPDAAAPSIRGPLSGPPPHRIEPTDVQRVVVLSGGAPERPPWVHRVASGTTDASATGDSGAFPWSPRLFPASSCGGWKQGDPDAPAQPSNTQQTVNRRFWGSSVRFYVNGVDQGVAFIHLTGGERLFPAASPYAGGAVTFNPGPDFAFPPPLLAGGPAGAPDRRWRALSELEGDETAAVGAGLGFGAAHSLHLQHLLGVGLSLQSLDGLQSILGGAAAEAFSASSSMRAVQGTIVLPGGPPAMMAHAGGASSSKAGSARPAKAAAGASAASKKKVPAGPGEKKKAPATAAGGGKSTASGRGAQGRPTSTGSA